MATARAKVEAFFTTLSSHIMTVNGAPGTISKTFKNIIDKKILLYLIENISWQIQDIQSLIIFLCLIKKYVIILKIVPSLAMPLKS